jgi:hypothetical protein
MTFSKTKVAVRVSSNHVVMASPVAPESVEARSSQSVDEIRIGVSREIKIKPKYGALNLWGRVEESKVPDRQNGFMMTDEVIST